MVYRGQAQQRTSNWGYWKLNSGRFLQPPLFVGVLSLQRPMWWCFIQSEWRWRCQCILWKICNRGVKFVLPHLSLLYASLRAPQDAIPAFLSYCTALFCLFSYGGAGFYTLRYLRFPWWLILHLSTLVRPFCYLFSKALLIGTTPWREEIVCLKIIPGHYIDSSMYMKYNGVRIAAIKQASTGTRSHQRFTSHPIFLCCLPRPGLKGVFSP